MIDKGIQPGVRFAKLLWPIRTGGATAGGLNFSQGNPGPGSCDAGAA